MSAKKQKPSAQVHATAVAVEKLLDDVPADELDDTLAAVELKLEAAKARLKTLGKDASFERLVSAALSWISQARAPGQRRSAQRTRAMGERGRDSQGVEILVSAMRVERGEEC